MPSTAQEDRAYAQCVTARHQESGVKDKRWCATIGKTLLKVLELQVRGPIQPTEKGTV
jgi:hypothetical protein